MESATELQLVWVIPLPGGAQIRRPDRYLKSGDVVEGTRRDGRSGMLRAQMNFTPEGHAHVRSLQVRIGVECLMWIRVACLWNCKNISMNISMGEHGEGLNQALHLWILYFNVKIAKGVMLSHPRAVL